MMISDPTNILDITGAIEKRFAEIKRLVALDREAQFLCAEVRRRRKTITADELANRIRKAQDDAWILVDAINIKSGDLEIR